MQPRHAAREKAGFMKQSSCSVVACLLMIFAAAPAVAQTAPAATQPAKAAASPIDRAVIELIKEANDLDDIEKPDAKPYFSRPHPVISTLGNEVSLQALDRMLLPFTTNEYRDTYIRWHLMSIVNRTSAADRKATGPKLLALLKAMPGPLDAKTRPERRYEPEEIANKYFSLINSATRVVGYPPFQRQIGPPEVYKYVKPEEIARIKANLAEVELLKDKFKTIVDQKAVQWNNRIRQVNYIVRLYRGELIYAIIQTGDPQMLAIVFTEIDKQARLKNGIAFDLLAYVYLATFDGVMELYPAGTLKLAAQQLNLTAGATNAYIKYGGTTRNFGDYAFHLVAMLNELADEDSSMLAGEAPDSSDSPAAAQPN